MHYLSGLPPELMIEIVRNTKGREILELRLASRPLYGGLQDEFCLRYLTIRAHTYTHFGLRTLLGISTHPVARFRVREIEIWFPPSTSGTWIAC